MKKEDIEAVAKLLTSFKDSIGELELALKEKNLRKFAETKSKIMRLHMQIDNKI